MLRPSLARPAPRRLSFLVAALVSIYAISQFLRNSIGVIANDLARELDLSATQTGLLSSAFFFSFAAVQIPIGILIDRYGPKRTMLATAVLTVLGTILFALASSASVLIAARVLMGLGCSTFFMAPLVIYARRFPPERFAEPHQPADGPGQYRARLPRPRRSPPRLPLSAGGRHFSRWPF